MGEIISRSRKGPGGLSKKGGPMTKGGGEVVQEKPEPKWLKGATKGERDEEEEGL